MHNKIKVLQLALIAFAAGGCASQPSTTMIGADGETSAFMQGTWRGQNAYYVGRVDAAPIKRPSLQKDWARPFAIPSGERLLVVQYEESAAIPSSSRGASGAIKVTLQPNVNYAPDGRDDGRSVVLWIKRLDTGVRVSEEVNVLKAERPAVKPGDTPHPPSIRPPVDPTHNIPRL